MALPSNGTASFCSWLDASSARCTSSSDAGDGGAAAWAAWASGAVASASASASPPTRLQSRRPCGSWRPCAARRSRHRHAIEAFIALSKNESVQPYFTEHRNHGRSRARIPFND